MNTSEKKSLLKILIAVAWIDGQVQLQERQYLLQVAEDLGLTEDPEIKPLLHGLRAISIQECYAWIESYLGQHPTMEAGNELIEAVSGLIYSDGQVANEEAKLVSRLVSVNASQSKPHHLVEGMLNAIQHLYQRWRNQRSAT